MSSLHKMKDSSFNVMATFSSALAHALMCWKARSGLEGQAARGAEAFVHISVGIPTVYGKCIGFQALPFELLV